MSDITTSCPVVDEGALEVKGLKWTQVQMAGLGCLAGLEGVSSSPWQNHDFQALAAEWLQEVFRD